MIGHRDALRERREHQSKPVSPTCPAEARCRRFARRRKLAPGLICEGGRHDVDHTLDVREIVCDRGLAILARHPTGDHLVGAPLIEAVETLNRHQVPSIGAWNRPQARELRIGAFGVTVESHEQTSRHGRGSREQQIASVRGCCDGSFDHQMTFTTPEPRMSASRVMSGRSMVRAVAQMSASNGSRLNRNSSAR